jgi:diguanylate cyclase (GGDEF)-like protein
MILKGILNATKDSMAALDRDYRYIAFNTAYESGFKKLYGVKIEVGMSIKDALAHIPEDRDRVIAAWTRALNGEEFTLKHDLGDPNLERNPYEISYSTLYDKSGNLIGATDIVRNISERLKEERQIRDSKIELEKTFHTLKQHDEEISLINEMDNGLQACSTVEETLPIIRNYCSQILQFSSGILYLMHSSRNYLEAVTDWNMPQTNEKIFSPDQCWGLRQTGKIYEYLNPKLNLQCAHAADRTKEIKVSEDTSQEDIKDFVNNNEKLIYNLAGQIALSISNIKLQETLRIRSLSDPLTGLNNRAYINQYLERDIQKAKAKLSSIAIVMIDLDYFKTINDTYGHDAGDEVLLGVGRMLLEEIRKTDIACRYGGEEFLLIFFDTNLAAAFSRVKAIKEKISQIEFRFGGKIIDPLTASFGISLYPENGDDAAKLIEAADRALYESKKSGRNKITIYQNFVEPT